MAPQPTLETLYKKLLETPETFSKLLREGGPFLQVAERLRDLLDDMVKDSINVPERWETVPEHPSYGRIGFGVRLDLAPEAESLLKPIQIYTDGSCASNPGPCGAGVVWFTEYGGDELSKPVGHGTNNYAELMAIWEALKGVRNSYRAVVLHSDSMYSIDVLTGAKNARKNALLIADIQKEMRRFRDLTFKHVKGHSGIPQNERADVLAKNAALKKELPAEQAGDFLSGLIL